MFHKDGTLVTMHSAYSKDTPDNDEMSLGSDECFPAGYRNVRILECDDWQKATIMNLQSNVIALANYALFRTLLLSKRIENIRRI